MRARRAWARAREPVVLLAPGLAVLVVAFALPVVQLLALSLGDGPSGPGGVALGQYRRFLADRYYLGVALRTLRLAGGITLACLVVGLPVAYVMARGGTRLRRWLAVVIVTPLLISVVIRTFGWLVILGRGGLLASLLQGLGLAGPGFALMHTEVGVVIALTQVLLPFMTLTLAGVLGRVDPRLEEAARTMGCGFVGTLWRVTLPLSLPGVVAGSLLVFALAISSFITPALVGGVRLPVLAGSIYQQVTVTLDWPFAAAQSAVLLLAVLVLVAPASLLLGARRG